MKYNTLILSLLLFLLSANACPRKEDLLPCICDGPEVEGSAYITCSKLENDQELTTSAKSLIGKNYIYSITIQDSAFNYISSGAFKGLKFVELEIKDSTLRALTDTDVAFEGLEDHLEIFRMENCDFLSEWDWSMFRKLKKLSTLEIENGALENIEDMGKINLENLKTVSFAENKINFIDDKAFSNCEKLMIVVLKNNKISILKRTMIPNPAPELIHIDLNHNEIEQLPDDMFSNMPKLENLSIGGNKILVIGETIFSSIWSQLETFEAMGNELRCDCRMTWILNTKQPKAIRAACANPQALKGRNIQSLTSKDLWCIY
ncbi:leucine-rich repeat neuronal protein 3-like [Parasteatoda tepidariorum]|uniref:leucine-rich repeat neuronal protein 3-like n=1 Tax=Parasteatoda tepidariorum TaxID=114398 RepID=UPI0039BC8D52